MKTLIVGSSELDLNLLSDYLTWADETIACDGGFDHFAHLGAVPDVVLGDQDSVKAKIRPTELYAAEKDFTDLEAAIHRAAQASSEIVILGATGGRLDHFLNAVMQLFHYDLPIRLIDHQNEIFVKKTSFSFERTKHKYFSLIPLDEVRLSIRGAKYPLEDVLVSPYSSLTVSNEAGGLVEVTFTEGRVIVVFSSDK